MYKCFKDCLLSPAKIINHLNMKTSKLIAYFIILVCLYTLPFCVMFVTSFGGNRAITDAIEDDFKANEVINYQIVDGKLQGVNNATQGFTAEELSSTIGVNVNFIFAKNEKLNINLFANNVYFVFREDHLEILYTRENTYDGTIDGNQSQLSAINNDNAKFTIIKLSYEKLNFDNIDFNKDSKDFEFKVTAFYNRLINYVKPTFYLIGIPSLIFALAISLFGGLLLIAFLLRIFNRMLDIQFGTYLKIAMLCSTVRVVGEILAVCLQSSFISYIAYFAMLIYILIAIRLTSMVKHLQKNNNNTGEQNEL